MSPHIPHPAVQPHLSPTQARTHLARPTAMRIPNPTPAYCKVLNSRSHTVLAQLLNQVQLVEAKPSPTPYRTTSCQSSFKQPHLTGPTAAMLTPIPKLDLTLYKVINLGSHTSSIPGPTHKPRPTKTKPNPAPMSHTSSCPVTSCTSNIQTWLDQQTCIPTPTI